MKGPNDFRLLPDYHLHTALCKHASGDVRQYKEAARRLGIPEICFADHAPNPHGYDYQHRMVMAQFPSYREMVSDLQDNEPPNVLLGVEADYYEGCEGFLREWLPEQNLDFVLGSVHYIGDWGFDSPSQMHVWESVDVEGAWRRYFDLVLKLVEMRLCDAVSHLDLPKKFGYRPSDKALKGMLGPVLDRIAEVGMGMEINVSGRRRPAREIYPSPMITAMACERKIPICFGSDAHRPEEVGADFDIALNMAREAGYTHYFRIRRREKERVPLPPG